MIDDIKDNIDIDINKKNKYVKYKHLKFKDERLEILKKIYNILDINENNREFKSHLLDLDELKQKQILDLDEDIKKYFKVAAWPAYKNLNTERRYLSLVKYILKDMDIKYESMGCKLKYENRLVNTTIYTIQSNLFNKKN